LNLKFSLNLKFIFAKIRNLQEIDLKREVARKIQNASAKVYKQFLKIFQIFVKIHKIQKNRRKKSKAFQIFLTIQKTSSKHFSHPKDLSQKSILPPLTLFQTMNDFTMIHIAQ